MNEGMAATTPNPSVRPARNGVSLLLRVLQEKEIERVGGTLPVKVDIRIIAATHRNLEIMIEERKFREDHFV